MSEMRDKMVRQLQRDIEHIQKRIAELDVYPLEEIAETFPEASISLATFGVAISFPMDWLVVSRWKLYVAEKHPDWQCHYDKQLVWDDVQRGGYFLDYWIGDYNELDVNFRTEVPGSTCVMHEIGTKVVPVFEMACAEAAEESNEPK